MVQGATRKQSSAPLRSRGWGQLWRRTVTTVAATAVVCGVIFVGRELSRLPIREVVVTGDLERLRKQALQEHVSESLEGGFLGADLDVIREPLEQLPWVYRAQISRQWPSTLQIRVTEQLPIARWGDVSFLNHEGDVFTPGHADGLQELPVLSGPEGSQRQLIVHYSRIQETLMPFELQVASLHMDARGSVRAQLLVGGELILGRDDFDARLRRFTALYPAHLAQRADQLQRIDLRYMQGVAVAWNDRGLELSNTMGSSR